MKTITVKGRTIGGTKTLVCVPLVGRTEEALLTQAKAVAALQPDLIEWRADYLNEILDNMKRTELLRKLRAMLPDFPIIFTCRDKREGGVQELENGQKLAVIQSVIETGLVDLVDVELISGIKQIEKTMMLARQFNTHVIISYHDFMQTPETEKMLQILCKEQEAGADIAKLAVMPQSPRDVLRLLEATSQFQAEYAVVPVIAMSMSQLGIVSRIAGRLFGSAITFASHQEQSAPGQISITKIRTLLDAIER